LELDLKNTNAFIYGKDPKQKYETDCHGDNMQILH